MISNANEKTGLTFGTIIITAIALFSAIGGVAADYNKTHLFNPNWPPHARFHNAQTMLFGVYLGVLSLYFLWFARLSRIWRIKLGVLLASLYWLAQGPSILFPGTALQDPEFTGGKPANGFQLYMDAVLLALLAIAYFLEWRRSIKNA